MTGFTSELLFGAVILIGGGSVAVALAHKLGTMVGRKRLSPHFRYVKQPLMTQNELKFYRLLVQACPGAMIAPQVSMGGLIAVRPYNRSAFFAFCHQRADFVLYDPDTGAVDCVIELDDASHDNKASQQKDRNRDLRLKEAQIPYLRFDFRKGITVSQIRADVRRAVTR